MNKENLECSLHTSIAHCVAEAHKLPCGHYVCSNCLTKAIIKFECKHCGSLHKNEKFKIRNKFETINKTCKASFEFIAKQYQNALSKFEECENISENRFVYLLDEIDVRVESLKMELDILHDKARSEVIRLHEDFKKNIKHQRVECENETSKLTTILSDHRKQTTANLEDFTDKMKTFYEMLDKYNKGIEAEISEKPLDLTNILTKIDSIESQLELKDHKYFELDEHISQMVALENRIAVIKKNEIEIYDPINDSRISKQLTFRIRYIVTQNNTIYMSLKTDDKVMKTDLDFNILKDFAKLPDDGNKYKSIQPRGIAYYKGFIYVRDAANYGVIKLNENLEFVKFIQLTDEDKKIQQSSSHSQIVFASNGIACITSFCGDTISFYDVEKDFKMIFQYAKADEVMNICLWKDDFYIFSSNDEENFFQPIAWYNNTGELKNLIQIKKPFDYMDYRAIYNLNGNLYSSVKAIEKMDFDTHDYYNDYYGGNYGNDSDDYYYYNSD